MTSALVGILAVEAPPAAAAPVTFTVTRTADDHNPGSLRHALDQANAGSSDAVTIMLPAGTYTLNACASTEDDTNVAGDLDALGAAPLTLEGQGTGATVKQTCADERVLDQRGAGLLTVRNVTITGGSVTGNPAVGGGIRAAGAVTLDHATITNNEARGAAGRLLDPNGAGASAGGVFATGEVTATDSTITNNRAIAGSGISLGNGPTGAGGDAAGGALQTREPVHLLRTTVSGNDATGGAYGVHGAPGHARGGAISSGPLDATAVTFNGNLASGIDGWWELNCFPCIIPRYIGVAGGSASGGAIESESVTLHDVTATGNRASAGTGVTSDTSIGQAAGSGGAVLSSDVVVVGGRFAGNGSGGGGAIAGGTVTITGTAFEDNGGQWSGGAVAAGTARVTGASFVGNRAVYGGGVSATTFEVDGSRFERNHAGPGSVVGSGTADSGSGGAVHVSTSLTARRTAFLGNDVTSATGEACPSWWQNPYCPGLSLVGGAISASGAPAGSDVTLDAVTIADNEVDGFATFTPVVGGGGGVWATGTVHATNSTLTGNRASIDGLGSPGAAIHATATSLTQTTVVGNTGDSTIDSEMFSTRQSILALHEGAHLCSPATATTSLGANWWDGSCGAGDGTDHTTGGPLYLGPLQDNGGPTPTRALAPYSSAADAVDPAGCVPTTDQRGVARPQGPACDVGAVETVVDPAAPAADLGVRVDGPTTAIGGSTLSVPITVSSTGQIGFPHLTIVVDDPTPAISIASEDLPAGVECVAGAPGTVSCTWPEGLAAGTETTLVARVQLGAVTGTTTVRAQVANPGPDRDAGNNTASLSIVRQIGVDLRIAGSELSQFDGSMPTGSAARTLVQGGTTQHVEVVVANGGPTPYTATTEHPLEVVADLPPGISVGAPAEDSGWVCASTTRIECSFVGLVSTTVLHLPLRADASASPGSETLTFALEGVPVDDLDPMNNSRTLDIDVVPGADLHSTLALESLGGPTVRATAVITNDGPMPARPGFSLDTSMGSTFTSWDASLACAAQAAPGGVERLSCTSSTPLAAGSSVSFVFTADVKVRTSAYATFSFLASPIEGFQTVARPATTAQGLMPPLPADLEVTMTGPASLPIGRLAEYRATVLSREGVGYPTLTVAVPAGWNAPPPSGPADPPAIVAPSGVTCEAHPTQVRCTWAAPVAEGSGDNVLIRVRLALTTGDTTVAATISGLGPDDNPANDTASVVTTRTAQADLAITSLQMDSATPGTGSMPRIRQGGHQRVQITVANLAGTPVTGTPSAPVRILVDLPPGFTVTEVGAPWTCATTAGDLACSLLGPLTTSTLQFELWSGVAGPQERLLFAAVGVDAPPDPVPSNNRASLFFEVVAATDLGTSFHPTAPMRILDSRGPTGGWAGPLAAGAPRTLLVGGPGTALPAGLDSVVLNVTVTNPTANSFLTVYPAGGVVPQASNLNFAQGQTIPNAVTVKVGAGDKIAFANAVGATHVIVDVVGYYHAQPGDRFNPLTPTRLLDSRTGTGFNGKVTAGTPKTLQVSTPTGPVPTTADAVVLNVTVTGGTANSFLTVYPGLTNQPTASNLNFAPGQTTANLVTVKLSDLDTIQFANAAGAVDVVADIVGYFDPTKGDLFHSVAPIRLLDSRGPTGGWNALLAATTPRSLQVTGGAVRADATAVVANTTVTASTANSYLTVQPAGTPAATTSNLNFATGQTIPNLVTTKVGTNGQITFRTNTGATHVIYDLDGWYAPT